MEKRKMNICLYLLIIFSITYINIGKALSRPYVFLQQIGSFGTGDGQFRSPADVAIDAQGNIYVADMDGMTSRIQKFTSDGTYITKWGSYGTGDGQFASPNGIAIDPSGYVYVADEHNDRIQKFTSNGIFVTKWGISGSGDGQFSNPLDISIDADGYIYVLDASNGRIQRFTSNGTFLSKWNTGSNNDQAMALDPSGNIYITDNFTVRKFTVNGVFIKQWGSEGADNGQFEGAYGIAVDNSGNVFVSDYFNYRIQEFTSEGVFVDATGAYGTGNGQFRGPEGIAFDPSGNLYVADWGSHRVEVFAPTNEGTLGTQITLTGGVFGTRKGKVFVGNVALRVLGWSDSNIRCQLGSALPPGIYDITIQPQLRGVSPIIIKNGFVVELPKIDMVDPAHGVPGNEITISGFFFGTKKGKVILGLDKCVVHNWTMDANTGESEIKFVVPKGLSSGTHELKVTNGVGTDTMNFTID